MIKLPKIPIEEPDMRAGMGTPEVDTGPDLDIYQFLKIQKC